jgi:hypothetical protein
MYDHRARIRSSTHIRLVVVLARKDPDIEKGSSALALECARVSPIDRSSTLAFGAVEQVRLHQARLQKLSSPSER